MVTPMPTKAKVCEWCGGKILNNSDQDKCVNCGREEFPARIILNGRIAEKHFAKRKIFQCSQCKKDIPRFSYYYSVIYAGAGVANMKFRDYCHQECIEKYLKVEQSSE